MENDQLPRRLVLGVCCLLMMGGGLVHVGPALLLTAIAVEFDMGFSPRGMFLGAVFGGMLPTILLSGPLADRIGFRFPLTVSFAIQTFGMLLVSWAQDFWMIVVGAVLLGLGRGFTSALMTPIVCLLYPKRRAAMTNALHTFFCVGLVVLVLLVMFLLHRGWDWRQMFRLLAVVTASFSIIILLTPFPHRTHGGSERMRFRTMMRHPIFAALAVGLLIGTAVETGSSMWLPNFVEEVTRSKTRSGVSLLLFGLAMGTGRFFCTNMVERLGVLGLFALVCPLCAAALVLAACDVHDVVTIGCLAVVGFSVAGFFPTMLAVAADRFPHAGASMYSSLTMCGIGGGLIGPLLIGWGADAFGLRWAMGMVAGLPLALLVFMWYFLRHNHLKSGCQNEN
jgi:fucose permease